jgi:hypothetical protein
MHEAAADPRVAGTLFCLECGEPARGTASGWRAYIIGGFEGEPLEVVVYCPSCRERALDDDLMLPAP